MWIERTGRSPLAAFADHLSFARVVFVLVYAPGAAAVTNGVVMDMSVALSSSEFSKQAQETVSMAFALCESRLQAKGSQLSPELRPCPPPRSR